MADAGEFTSPQARSMGYEGNQRIWKTVDKDDAVDGVVTLNPEDVSVIATIPLADADSYSLQLPEPAEAFERDFVILGIRASGVYVDGEVQVTAPASVRYALPTIDPMTASNSRLRVQNVRGQWYDVLADSFTS